MRRKVPFKKLSLIKYAFSLCNFGAREHSESNLLPHSLRLIFMIVSHRLDGDSWGDDVTLWPSMEVEKIFMISSSSSRLMLWLVSGNDKFRVRMRTFDVIPSLTPGPIPSHNDQETKSKKRILNDHHRLLFRSHNGIETFFRPMHSD